MFGKYKTTDQDEEVIDEVERAKNVVDEVRSPRDILLTSNYVCSTDGINVQDEMKLRVDGSRKRCSPEKAGKKCQLVLELKRLLCFVHLYREDAQQTA